jgi:hypothetical protein
VRDIGTRLVAEMCQKILAADLGIVGFHFYTMNLEKGTTMLLEQLGFVPSPEMVKPFPWRPVSLPLPTSCMPKQRRSHSRPSVAKKRRDPSSGPTEPSRTWHARQAGTSFRTGAGATRAARPSARSTATGSPSSSRRPSAASCGTTRSRTQMSRGSLPRSAADRSTPCRGPSRWRQRRERFRSHWRR